MRFSIRLKLIGYTFFIVSLVGLMISWFSIEQSKKQILDTYEKECRQTTNLIAESILNDVYFLDMNALRQHLEDTKINPDITYIKVADVEGIILFEGSDSYIVPHQKISTEIFGQKILKADEWISMTQDKLLKVGGPLKLSDGSKIGFIEIDYTLTRAQQIIDYSRRITLYLSLLCLAGGALLAYFISSHFIKPFKKIVDATHEIGRGNFRVRVDIKRKDELGTLAQSFNQMAEELENNTAAILKLNDKLKRSNKELEQFAYVASHDLQEPIYIIQGFVDTIREQHTPVLNEDMSFLLERISHAAERMKSLIEGLLEFSRIGTSTKPFEPVDLNVIVQEIITDLELRIKETNAKIEIGKLPTLQGDKLQMHQLFQNLIGNALKFHQKDKAPEVKIYSHPKHDSIEIYVEDNGIGFDKEYADKIFVPFQRLHTRSEYQGNGIGLAICEKIVLRHHGKISAQGEINQGATFIMQFPL